MKKINFVFGILILLCSNTISAQLSGYSFVRQITVSNTSTATAINYQLKLTVNTQSLIAANQMLATGDDIRFGKTCNGSTLYNYWIESGINTSSTIIWVKIDSIAAGGTRNFFMFYGNNSATPVSTVSIFSGPHSSTDSVASGSAGGVGNSQRGFRFTPTEDLLVTHIGKREPTGSTRTVTLFDFTTTAIVTQYTVAGAAAQYSYNALPSPVWLTNGTQYILSLYQDVSDGYYFGNSSQIGQHMTYGDMRYCNSCTQNTFPTNVLTNYHYGYPDLWYYIKNNITPAPTYTFDSNNTSVTSISPSSTIICAGNSATLNASNPVSGMIYSWMPGAINGSSVVVSPSVNTTYTVNSTLAACTISYTPAYFSLTVNSLPMITVNGGAICTGDSFTMTPSGAITYTYSSGSAIVSPTVNSSYTVSGTDANGCDNFAISSVTVNSLPTVSVATSNSVICGPPFQGTATINATGATSYTWSTGSFASGISVSPSVTTTYSVTGVDANGCSNTAMITQTVSACTGISAVNGNLNALNVYPNPSNGSFNIEVSGSEKMEIIVSNNLGQIVLSESIRNSKGIVNLQHLPNGIYTLKVNDQTPVKIIKQ